jgi:hypothetical protein
MGQEVAEAALADAGSAWSDKSRPNKLFKFGRVN